jgi:hypothetical protein
MLPKHAPSIPQNMLEYVNTKFVRHWMSEVWKHCNLRKKKKTLFPKKIPQKNKRFNYKQKKKKKKKKKKQIERKTKFL